MKRLKDNRSWFLVLIFTILTVGIYGIYFYHIMARDTNIACSYDGKKTSGVFKYILFSLLTFGLYSIIWEYKILSRWKNQAENNGEQAKLSPNLYLILNILLSFTGICTLIAFYLRIMGLNQMCYLYNETNPEEKIDHSKDNWGWKFN